MGVEITMSESHTTDPVNLVNGIVQPSSLTPNQIPNTHSESPLPSRPKKGFSVSSKDSVFPPGHQLTGKQEHCELSPIVETEINNRS